MANARLVAALILLSVLAALCTSQSSPPTFSSSYRIVGELRLPYAEIVEPFGAFYDGPNKRSRIDYYGFVKTLQVGNVPEYGTNLKIVYMTNYQVTNQKSCFQSNGTSDAPVTPQSVLPDTTGFTLKGNAYVLGQPVESWQLKEQNGGKINTYTLWVNTHTRFPVRYEMMGYDTLLGSHYDKYYLDYLLYKPDIVFTDDIFQPDNLTCTGFPGPGVEHRVTVNPMREFIHREDTHVHELFEQFKAKHGKDYEHDKEHENRKHIFRQNVRYIHSKNRAGLTYSMAINHLSDRTSSELKFLRGFRRTLNYPGGLPFNKSEIAGANIPDQWDWRLVGAVTPVKDQAVCGSCWSFGTTGTIEGAYFLKYGQLVRFSQQQLIDCSWGEGNNGCDGGEDFRSYDWIMKMKGLTSEDQYGQYLAVDGRCKTDSVKPVVQLSGYVNVTPYDQDALRTAIAVKGPISVAIDASHKSLSFYANGVYYEPQCGNKPEDLDHAVLAVGYGTLNGEKYWLVKNSWSTYWGNDGYVLFSQRDNNCGVATSPTYPIIQ